MNTVCSHCGNMREVAVQRGHYWYDGTIYQLLFSTSRFVDALYLNIIYVATETTTIATPVTVATIPTTTTSTEQTKTLVFYGIRLSITRCWLFRRILDKAQWNGNIPSMKPLIRLPNSDSSVGNSIEDDPPWKWICFCVVRWTVTNTTRNKGH